MKTREIECWVENQVIINNVERLDTSFVAFTRDRKDPAKSNLLKARLIIEVPPKKIELTEEQFDEVMNSTPMITFGFGPERTPDLVQWARQVKEKLFGGEE